MDCRVVVVAGSIGPWRPERGFGGMQGWLVRFFALDARIQGVGDCDVGMFEALFVRRCFRDESMWTPVGLNVRGLGAKCWLFG